MTAGPSGMERVDARTHRREGAVMGLFKGAAKAGIAVKLIQVARREAAKPENQARARELVRRLKDRRTTRRR